MIITFNIFVDKVFRKVQKNQDRQKSHDTCFFLPDLMVLIFLMKKRALQRKLRVVYLSPVISSVSKSILIIPHVCSYFVSAIQNKNYSMKTEIRYSERMTKLKHLTKNTAHQNLKDKGTKCKINLGNSSHYSVQPRLPSRALFET